MDRIWAVIGDIDYEGQMVISLRRTKEEATIDLARIVTSDDYYPFDYVSLCCMDFGYSGSPNNWREWNRVESTRFGRGCPSDELRSRMQAVLAESEAKC